MENFKKNCKHLKLQHVRMVKSYGRLAEYEDVQAFVLHIFVDKHLLLISLDTAAK